jgi:uncharacterized protein (TIGR02145 family)
MKYKMNYLICCMIGIVIFFSSCSELSKDESILSVTASKLISDIDGNTYKTVTIGEQTWLAENLRVSHFSNGDPILHVTGNYEWFEAGRDGIPAWRYYNDDPSTAEKYGKLYNGFAVSDARGLAPEGWRLPGDADWEKLFIALGGEFSESSPVQIEGDGDVARNFNNRIIFYKWTFKKIDSGDRFERGNDIISNVFDAFGFNFIAAGQIDKYGNFYYKDEQAKFWCYPTEQFTFSFTDGSSIEHSTIRMRPNTRAATQTIGFAPSGKSVRLVKE